MDTNTQGSMVVYTAQNAGGAQPVFASIVRWCDLSGMGRSSTYEALGTGHLRAIKMGAKTLIDVAHGLAWLRSLPPASIRAPHQKAAA